MSALTALPTEAAFEAHVATLPSQALLVAAFHAPWAAPCAQMRTLLETLAATYPASSPASISFVWLDAEELPDVSERYDVTAVPFLVLQRNGVVLESLSGCDAARIRAAVERHHAAATTTANGAASAIPPALEPDAAAVARAKAAAQASGTAGAVGAAAEPAGQQTANGAAAAEQTDGPGSEELNARLAGLVKAAPVMLFMKGTPSAPQCGFSRQLVGLLRENGVRYGFFNILADEDVRQGLKVWADWPTFPQLWVAGELVGGLDIVKEEVENNPDFFAEYSVHSGKDSAPAPETQRQSAAAV